MKEKKYKARPIADVSIQFYRDRQRTPNFLLTMNNGEPPTGFDAYLFAEAMSTNESLSQNWKSWLKKFCREYIKLIN